MRRAPKEKGRRSKKIYTVLTKEEEASFCKLRWSMGLGSSQAVRYFILKAIAFEMGRRLSGRASVREGWVSHKKAGDGASR